MLSEAISNTITNNALLVVAVRETIKENRTWTRSLASKVCFADPARFGVFGVIKLVPEWLLETAARGRPGGAEGKASSN